MEERKITRPNITDLLMGRGGRTVDTHAYTRQVCWSFLLACIGVCAPSHGIFSLGGFHFLQLEKIPWEGEFTRRRDP